MIWKVGFLKVLLDGSLDLICVRIVPFFLRIGKRHVSFCLEGGDENLIIPA